MIEGKDKCSDGHLKVLENWYRGDMKYKIISKVDDTPEFGEDYDSALYVIGKINEHDKRNVDKIDVAYLFPKFNNEGFEISIDYQYVVEAEVRYHNIEDIVDMVVDIVKRRILK
jgi:hypothetical protein